MWLFTKSLAIILLLGLAIHHSSAQSSNPFSPIDRYLADSVDNNVVAGGVLLIHHKGKTVYHSGFGYADIETRNPFPSDVPVIVASISKPILGTTMYRLMELGKVDMAAPASQYLPKIANGKLESGETLHRSPTITELFTHSAGLRFDSAPKGRIWFQDWVRNQTLEHVVDRVISDFPFKTQPGTKSAYSGIGTDIAARIGELTSESPRNEMLLKHFAKPLGMKTTFYRDAIGMERLNQKMPTRYRPNPKTGKMEIYKGRALAPTNRYSSSGGTVISTAADLLLWLRMIRNGGKHEGKVYLSPENLAALLTPHDIGKNARGGLFVREKDSNGKPSRYGHTGSSGTNVWIDFEHDVIGIMLTQTSNIKTFRIEIEKRVTRVLEGI